MRAAALPWRIDTHRVWPRSFRSVGVFSVLCVAKFGGGGSSSRRTPTRLREPSGDHDPRMRTTSSIMYVVCRGGVMHLVLLCALEL